MQSDSLIEKSAVSTLPEQPGAVRGRHLKFRIARSLRWAFFTWLVVTGLVGGVGGVVFGFGIGHQTFSVPSAILAWMMLSSFTVSLIVAVGVFLGGIFRVVSDDDLSRFAARRLARAWREVDEAKKVAARHLEDPMYIVDYAKRRRIRLDDVHRAVREGHLRIYWHDGIAFVDANGEA